MCFYKGETVVVCVGILLRLSCAFDMVILSERCKVTVMFKLSDQAFMKFLGYVSRRNCACFLALLFIITLSCFIITLRNGLHT